MFFHSVEKIRVLQNAEGSIGTQLLAKTCANPVCKRTVVDLALLEVTPHSSGRYLAKPQGKSYFRRRILPESGARIFPNYIPDVLLEDYREACLIKDLSPKAAATLIRRCLQGMIRDFCGISKNTLFKEIEELKKLVETEKAPKGVSMESVEAIDHVRNIGNIGAHMEKDVALVIPVEPEEATLLIELVETLFEDWYVTRQKRQERLGKIKKMAEEKDALKNSPKPLAEDQR